MLPKSICNYGKAVNMLNCLTAMNISPWMLTAFKYKGQN